MATLPAQVSAFVTAAHIKFLLLHDGRSEESIKNFFKDVYEAYLRVRVVVRHVADRCCRQVMMNPFLTPTSKITSPAFAQRVREKAKLYFR